MHLDWLSVTAPADWPLETVFDVFGGSAGFHRLRYGKRMYGLGIGRGGVRVFYDGAPDTGVHVEVTGAGCRDLVRAGVLTDPVEFLATLNSAGFRCVNIHLALDDHLGLLSMGKMRESVLAGHLVSQSRKWGYFEGGVIRGQRQGGTLYLGTAKSATRLAIYDKAAEQKVVGPWTRVELRLRNRNAQAMVRHLLKGGLTAACGVVRRCVDFKQPGRHSQPERWPSEPWWIEFLGECEKTKLSVSRQPASLERKKAWLLQSVAKPFAEVIFDEGLDFRELLLNVGAQRMQG